MTQKDAVVQVGEPVLREIAKPLAKKDIESAQTARLIAHMKEVLAKEKYGVGLAAPQVGKSLRLFIIAGRAFLPDEAGEDEKLNPPPDKVFINPALIRLSKRKREMSEGCLSVRDKYGTVMRHEKASVRAQDEYGNVFTYHGSGLIAHIFQHECDHLDGILFVDKAAKLEAWEEKDHLRKKYPAGERGEKPARRGAAH